MEILVTIDDGRKEMLKVAELLEKYDLKGIFYIAPFEGKNNLTVGDIIRLSKKHEIGGHTLLHTRLTNISLEDAKTEVEEGKKELESLIGKKITSFAYPRGWFNEDVKRIVKEAGFKEARTMKMGIIDLAGYDKFEKPVTAQNFPRPEYLGDTCWGIKAKFDEAKKNGNYFNLVIHTDDILKFNQFEWLENVFSYINENKNTTR